MKKLLCLSFLLLIGRLSFAQETHVEDTREVRAEKDSAETHVVTTHYSRTTDEVTVRNDVLVINPLKYWLFYNLSYLHMITPHIAVGGGILVPLTKEYTGFGFNLESRWYPGPHQIRGGYLAPTLAFNFLNAKDYWYYDGEGGSAGKSTSVAAGLILGWQWFWGDSFAAGLGLGFDYPIVQSQTDRPIPFINTTNSAQTIFRVDIGYGW